MKVIDNEKYSNSRPYIFTTQGIVVLNMFGLHSQEIVLSPREAITTLALAMVTIMAPSLLPISSKSDEDFYIYNP